MEKFDHHSTRANSRGSFNSHQPSALSTLFGSEMKMSVDVAELLERKEEEMKEKSVPSSSSYRESYTYAAPAGTSYQYTSNSFYQSYGDSYGSLPKSLLAKSDIDGTSNAGAKPLVSVRELLTIILEDATFKQEGDDSNISSSLDGRLMLNGEVDVQTKIESFQLLPAEEDGRPMEDLPNCTAQSDILNMGVRDFIVLDKRSKVQLVHIRIEGNLTPNDPFEGVLPSNNQIQLVSEEDHPGILKREESTQSFDNLYYTLDDEPENADTIEFFRTDTDEIKHGELKKTVNEILVQEKAENKLSKSHRHRSSSGNLVISYRRPNSQRWRVAKKLAVLSENAIAEHSSRSVSNERDRKSEIAQEVRKKLFESKAVPIPDPRYPHKHTTTSYELGEQKQQSEGLERRHSDRPYDDECDGDTADFERFKYSRKASTTSSRSSSFMDLNPHTSISLSAQFSPAGSEVQSSRDDSDDDQLGLIHLERANYLLAPSSSAYAGRSFGRDEATYPHPFKSSGQHRHNASASRTRIGSFTHVESAESPRHRPRGSGTSNSSKNNINLISQMNVKSILSMSDSDSDSDSSVEEDRFPIRQLHINTDFKAITTINSGNNGNQNYARKSPSRLNPFRSPGYERDGGDVNSDNGSTRSSITSSKSVLSRLYDLFGSSSKRRPSFASESNDSVNSSSVTPHQRRSEVGSDTLERPSLLLNQQISLPIIQNLDTGDVFPIGALRYEAFKLPETVSPTVLFGKPSDKIHR